MNDNEIYFAGIDDGFAVTKAVTANGCFKIPSVVRPGAHGLTTMGDSDHSSAHGFMTENQSYTVSEYIEGEETRFDGFPYSPISRVIVHDILNRAGLGGHDVIIATGLPISTYYEGGTPNMTAINAKRKNLSIEVTSMSETCAKIVTNHVFAEGISAWVDHVLDMEGNATSNEVMAGMVGVVDIGGRTTDCAVILPPGNVVDPSRKGSGNIGVLDIYDALATKIVAKYPQVGKISQHKLRAALESQTLYLWAKPHDISDLVRQSIEEVLPRIEREITRRIGSGADLDMILFVGGGTCLMKEAILSRFPNAVIPEQPEFANARGMYKLLMKKNKSAAGSN